MVITQLTQPLRCKKNWFHIILDRFSILGIYVNIAQESRYAEPCQKTFICSLFLYKNAAIITKLCCVTGWVQATHTPSSSWGTRQSRTRRRSRSFPSWTSPRWTSNHSPGPVQNVSITYRPVQNVFIIPGPVQNELRTILLGQSKMYHSLLDRPKMYLSFLDQSKMYESLLGQS